MEVVTNIGPWGQPTEILAQRDLSGIQGLFKQPLQEILMQLTHCP
jgi:hypothetical protein